MTLNGENDSRFDMDQHVGLPQPENVLDINSRTCGWLSDMITTRHV